MKCLDYGNELEHSYLSVSEQEFLLGKVTVID